MNSTTLDHETAGTLIFSAGFRIFFVAAGLWAVVSMGLWIAMLVADLELPTEWEAVSWHAHEFLFGYLGAVIAGFLLTAIPNWTGRPALQGPRLAGLFGLWVLGRVAIAFSHVFPDLLVVIADLAMPVTLTVFAAREIIVSNNKRNLVVVALLAILIVGNLVFHLEAINGDRAEGGYGLRTGLASAIMLIALIGGRITPAFTRNWLVQRQANRLPAQPSRFDVLALLAFAVSLALWVALPASSVTGMALLIAAGFQLARLARWQGMQTRNEMLLAALHIAFAFIPLGAAAKGLAILLDLPHLYGTAQHVWMAGAIGLMTVTVMLRAATGHSGRPLKANGMVKAIIAFLLVAVFFRLAAGLADGFADRFYQLSAIAWTVGFVIFLAHIGPMAVKSKPV